ncbi:DUF5615 family PIN-like protein [Candidatus Bipolaricaulota bacterium]|nr:DUF5615 family PIN-like protein [Candidatus Bipolaricaulota bacterium]MBS3792406.1 DUF5615 family PIN-like protein [Candidatus Bipolaricaulota bacterium]MBS3813013.1 DUF5615 family PIN-like protein [Candidatus Bipolaricaulota bacterium]
MAAPKPEHTHPALYFDEDSSNRTVVEALRDEGYDVLSTYEAGNGGNSDEEQLKFAISRKRALFSFDRGDFTQIHNEWWKKDRKHFGIILAIQQKTTEKQLISQLKQDIFEGRTKDQLKNQILWLSH